MDQYEKKTAKTKRSFTYTYYVSLSDDSSKPTLFFVHGFPDSAHMWQDVVAKMSDLPYKVIIPDCLGYGGTDKPADPAEYKFSGMAADIVDIMETENVKQVIIIGHDWGAGLAARFYNHYPQLVAGMILLNVAYMVPTGQKWDLDALNASTKEAFGYPFFEYWYLFTAPDGYKIINENLERFWECLHGNEKEWMRKMFCVRNGMVDYFKGDKRLDLKSFAREPRWKDDFIQRFRKDGLQGPTNWYKAMNSGYQGDDDKTIPKENAVVKVPFFFLGCTGDAVCRTELIYGPKNDGYLPDFEMTEITSDHWCAMEEPAKVADALSGFLKKRFP
jgi:soluble epoxide hydrolase / lipid-phosphate phosphatase